MTPLKQRFGHRPADGVWGDCHRAAIASILDLPLDEVQHFGDGGPDGQEFDRRVRDWLWKRGLVPVSMVYNAKLEDVFVCMKSMNPGIYYLLGGASATGVDHTVVGLEDRIVHDPSMNDSGIIGPCESDGLYWVTFLATATTAKRAA